MSTIATAYVQVLPSTRGMKSALSSELGGLGDDAGAKLGEGISTSCLSKLKNIGTFIAVGTAIGAAVVRGATEAVKEGAGLEQAIGGIETLFKTSSGKVLENAQKAFSTTGLSAREYMENVTSFAAALLNSLGGDTRKAADIADMAMRDMSDNANKMGTDMASIQNAYQGFAKQNYTMLDNLKLGYGGTKQEMERLLTDAQKLSGVRYDISNLSDVYSAIHQIQEQLGITGTTAKEAMTTVSGSFNALKASIKNVLGALTGEIDLGEALEGLGTSLDAFINDNLIPMLSEVFKSLPDVIGSLFNDGFSEGISKTTENIAVLLMDLATGVVEALANLLVLAPVIILSFVRGFAESLPRVLDSFASMFESIANRLPEMAGYLVEAIPSLIGAIIIALIKAIPAIIEAVVRIIIALGEAIISTLAAIIEAIPDMFMALGDLLAPIGKGIASAFGTAMQSLADFVAPAVQAINDKFGGLASSVGNLLSAMMGTFRSFANLVATAMSPIVGKFASIFANAVDALKSKFAGIEAFFASIVQKISGAVGAAVAKFREIGARIVANIKAGFEAAWENLVGAVRAKLDSLANMFNSITNKIDNLTNRINSSTDRSIQKTQTLNNTVNSNINSVNSGRISSSYMDAYESRGHLMEQPQQINVILSGSAKNVFDSVRVENSKLVTATGYKALA